MIEYITRHLGRVVDCLSASTGFFFDVHLACTDDESQLICLINQPINNNEKNTHSQNTKNSNKFAPDKSSAQAQQIDSDGIAGMRNITFWLLRIKFC